MTPRPTVRAADSGEAPAAAPLLRVVKGDPTDLELAALVAVVAARSGGTAEADEVPRSGWTDRSRALRRPMQPGPDGWRRSGLPSG